VIAGGLSFERAVSLASGRRIVHALRSEGYSADIYDLDEALLDRLVDDNVAVTYVAGHGADGEDGILQALLEITGVPFVGSGSEACRFAWDKLNARSILDRTAVRAPEYVALPREAVHRFGARKLIELVRTQLEFPLVVKPSAAGSAMGMTYVSDESGLPEALARAYAFSPTAVIERFVDGVEVAVCVLDLAGNLEPVPLAPLVVSYAKEYRFSFEGRYSADLIQISDAGCLDREIVDRVCSDALVAHRALRLRDVSRADFIVSDDGDVRLLEVAISPGMTDTSLFPAAVTMAGLEFSRVVCELVESAVGRRAGGR